MGNLRNFNALASLVLSVKPYFLFIIESRLHGSELLYLSLKFHNYSLHVEEVGRAGGLIFRWRTSLEVYIVSFFLHHISFRLCNMDGVTEWFGTGFYGWYSSEDK